MSKIFLKIFFSLGLMCFFMGCFFSDSGIHQYRVQKVSLRAVNRDYTHWSWKTPSTWKQTQAFGLRIGSFQIKDHVQVSLVLLNQKGQSLVRYGRLWRAELGMPMGTLLSAQRCFHKKKGKLGKFFLCFLENMETKQAILGAVFYFPKKTLFAKMRGTLQTVQEEQKHFLQWVQSIERMSLKKKSQSFD